MMTDSMTTALSRRCHFTARNGRIALVLSIAALMLLSFAALCIVGATSRGQDSQLKATTTAAEVGPPPYAFNPNPIVPWGTDEDIDGLPVLETERDSRLTFTWTFNDGEDRVLTGPVPVYKWPRLGT
jgi:hypothetical protein